MKLTKPPTKTKKYVVSIVFTKQFTTRNKNPFDAAWKELGKLDNTTKSVGLDFSNFHVIEV